MDDVESTSRHSMAVNGTGWVQGCTIREAKREAVKVKLQVKVESAEEVGLGGHLRAAWLTGCVCAAGSEGIGYSSGEEPESWHYRVEAIWKTQWGKCSLGRCGRRKGSEGSGEESG